LADILRPNRSLQYSGYSNEGHVAAGTGAASIVGGDGRAAILVGDIPPAGGDLPAIESSAQFAGHPEPGRDIFAAQPIDPAKSQAIRIEEAKQPQEQKVVSTVAVAAAKVINADELVKLNELPNNLGTPTLPNDKSTPDKNADQSDKTPEDKPTSDDGGTTSEGEPVVTNEPPKKQGPVVEEVAEADRVREELFNENSDQDVGAA
jgi:hypothetical protein